MTVANTPRSAGPYLGTGSTSVFTFAFKVFLPTDVLVQFVSATGLLTIGTLGTDYSVALNTDQNDDPGGSILTTVPLASGATLTIGSQVPLDQEVVLTNPGGFYPQIISDALDKVTILIQQSLTFVSGALRIPEIGSSAQILPAAAQRANKILSFDAQGNPVTIAAAAQSATALTIALAAPTGDTLVGAYLSDGATVGTVATALAEINQGLNDFDALQALAADLAAGTAATTACFGDSTMWGADPANLNNQVAVPPPAELQNFVNLFNGNSALTVTNNAISGTTCTQMIAGTDGSGSTFASKMAASTARVVFCNHGVNDAFGGSATTAQAYRKALLAFVQSVRANGKTPVLVTPHPALTIGGFGSQARCEATARFARIMRDVAAQHGVTLIDNFRYFTLMLGNDAHLPLAMFPDGVHAVAAIYATAGNNMADAILGGQVNSITKAGQRMPATSALVHATSQAISPSSSSRVGAVVTTSTVTPQTLRALFRVDQPGLDIILAHPIFSAGSAAIAITLDGVPLGSMSQLVAGFGASFWQDFETVLVRNCDPGFHILTFTTGSSGGAGLHYLRARDAEKPLLLPSGFASPSDRVLLAKKLDLNSVAVNTIFVCDTMPVSRFLDTLELEWTGQMLVNSGVVIGGNVGSNGGSAACERAVTIGLNGSGFLSIYEATAPATYTTTVVGAVDLSAASHLFRVTISPAGVVTLFVDNAQVGTTTNLTTPYVGGLLGLWKAANTGTLTVTDVSRVWRL